MIYIDLFSGILGFALGAYWSEIRFDKHYFSEVDEDAIELYRKRCPDAIPLGDITKIDWKALAYADRTRELQPEGCKQEERERIGDEDQTEYIITGGFPCQDLSVAGKGAGLEGSRSGLWTAMFEAIRILRPRYVIIENVGAIVGWFPRGLAGFSPDRPPDIDGDRWSVDIEQYQAIEPVLNDLNSIGYDAEWQDIRAEDMGAPHERKRIWIVAYPSWNGSKKTKQDRNDKRESEGINEVRIRTEGCSNNISNPGGKGLQEPTCPELGSVRKKKRESQGCELSRGITEAWRCWAIEPAVCGMVDGVSNKLDGYQGRLSNKSFKKNTRIKGLGNSILPQIAELFFRILKDLI